MASKENDCAVYNHVGTVFTVGLGRIQCFCPSQATRLHSPNGLQITNYARLCHMFQEDSLRANYALLFYTVVAN